MKKLLYFSAVAVLFFSCSVENLQDENSINFTNEQIKGAKPDLACISIDVVNSGNEFRGTAEAIVNHDLGIVSIRLTTYDWKIKVSKLYFGPIEQIESTKPDLFGLGKYEFTESFKEGVYVANYDFLLSNVQSDFALMAVLNLSNDYGAENAWTEGKFIQGVSSEAYYPGFLSNCIK